MPPQRTAHPPTPAHPLRVSCLHTQHTCQRLPGPTAPHPPSHFCLLFTPKPAGAAVVRAARVLDPWLFMVDGGGGGVARAQPAAALPVFHSVYPLRSPQGVAPPTHTHARALALQPPRGVVRAASVAPGPCTEVPASESHVFVPHGAGSSGVAAPPAPAPTPVPAPAAAVPPAAGPTP